MMLKLHVITPLCMLFVLQVFSHEAIQPKFSCASQCEHVDFGYAGICCGKIKSKQEKGNAHVNVSKPIAENVLGHNSAICEATDPIFWEVCPLGGYFRKT